MTRFVIDAPTLVHIVSVGMSVEPSHQLVAPNSIRSQALELLLEAVRGGDLSEQDAMAHHERITELKMRLLGDRVSRRVSWRLARDLDLSIHEAEYVAVTTLQADALVTVDPRLAATAARVVPLATLDDLAAR